MRIRSNSFFHQIIFSAFFVIVFAVGISAQYSGTGLVGSNIEPSRPRVIETQPPEIVVRSKAASTFDLEKQAFGLLNSQRIAKGLSPLVWDDDVAKIARMHSENMAKYKFFSHTGLDGLMVNERADKCGVSKWKAIGENIAYNRGYEHPVEFAVERWMQSVSHRENLLNNQWRQSAVGVAVANDGAYYFTQVFLLRK